ncbi:MAG: S8 family serine peptidase [Steroidobacteraceae bacterium]
MMWRTLAITVAVSCLSALHAEAQIQLPSVKLPEVPVVTGTLDRTAGTVGDTLQRTDLRDLRRLQISSLLRRHRDVLERDPRGEPIVRSELLSFDPSPVSLQRVQADGFTIAREQQSDELGTRLVVLLAPRGLSTQRALRRLQQLDPTGTYDFNHVYTGGGATDAQPPVNAPAAAANTAASLDRVRVGLVDTGVQQTHPIFATTSVHTLGCDGKIVPGAHGTAVASLMAMQIGARPTDLYSADVYCNDPTGGSVTAIANAFAWMARERVAVINVSLVGPANRMLERIIAALLQRGHVVVAAVGNDGPNAKPLYPAAYDGVIGVTGVDRKERVIIEAVRGPQVDFAAAGADITAGTIDNTYAGVRGTSFAAPIVTALIASSDRGVRPGAPADIVKRLAAQARDLGKPGFDTTYGFGLLAAAVPIQARRRE